MTTVAAVQYPPALYNLQESLARATKLIADAAAEGIELLVFPEAWIAGYPYYIFNMKHSMQKGELDKVYKQHFDSSVDLSKDGLAPIREAAREHGIVVVIGINERAGELSAGTLYNTAVTIDATGEIVNVHRKVMPTNVERAVWGFGDARGLNVVDTAVGRIGVLLCWENYMPLARAALYAQNVEIYCAPTAGHRQAWHAAMQHIGREGSTFVISVAQAIKATDIPADFSFRSDILPDDREWLKTGSGLICSPYGEIVAGPMTKEQGFLKADIDLEEVRSARRLFDVMGHYSRPDIFHLSVDRQPRSPVSFTDEPRPN